MLTAPMFMMLTTEGVAFMNSSTCSRSSADSSGMRSSGTCTAAAFCTSPHHFHTVTDTMHCSAAHEPCQDMPRMWQVKIVPMTCSTAMYEMQVCSPITNWHRICCSNVYLHGLGSRRLLAHSKGKALRLCITGTPKCQRTSQQGGAHQAAQSPPCSVLHLEAVRALLQGTWSHWLDSTWTGRGPGLQCAALSQLCVPTHARGCVSHRDSAPAGSPVAQSEVRHGWTQLLAPHTGLRTAT